MFYFLCVVFISSFGYGWDINLKLNNILLYCFCVSIILSFSYFLFSVSVILFLSFFFLFCRIKMPETYVVHLGNSKELMEVAEDSVAKRVLREHIRESLGVRDEDILFAIINSMFFMLIRSYILILTLHFLFYWWIQFLKMNDSVVCHPVGRRHEEFCLLPFKL